MLLKNYKIVCGIQFVKCWYSWNRSNNGRICSYCKFYDLKRDIPLCVTTEIYSFKRYTCFIDICAKSVNYDNSIRNPRIDSFTTYIPNQELYYLDKNEKIKKIEKT